MKERGWIEPIVERVVGQVLDSHAAQLRAEIVRRVMEEIAFAPTPVDTSATPQPSTSSPADLARAVAEIHLGSSQREILRALLDTSSRYAARVALFVVKGSHATGWQARSFSNSDDVKDFALDERAPAVVHAIRDRVAGKASVGDMDPRFLNHFGAPSGGDGCFFPLILKDKVAALLYADGGADVGPQEAGLLDSGSLELLVLTTGAWLEVNSLRKQAQKEPTAGQSESQPVPSASHASPAFNDPFAAHAPAFSTGHAMAAAASAGEAGSAIAGAPAETYMPPVPTRAMSSGVVEIDAALAEPISVDQGHNAQSAFEAVPEASAPPQISIEDQDLHRKAQRFARLLVDEIKLYNQAKVAEGRKNKDLYDRLKETIEKSRGTYQKRYGTTVASSGNYFQHEIIRSLAEDDASNMGANFRQ